MHNDKYWIWCQARLVATRARAIATPYGASLYGVLAHPGKVVRAVGVALEWLYHLPIQQPIQLTHAEGDSRNRTGSAADFSAVR
jgi:hypothetical protein